MRARSGTLFVHKVLSIRKKNARAARRAEALNQLCESERACREARLARLAAERQQRAQTLERQRAQEREARRRACAVRIAKRVRVEEERFKLAVSALASVSTPDSKARPPARPFARPSARPRAPGAPPGAPPSAPPGAPPSAPPGPHAPASVLELARRAPVRAAPVPPRAAVEALATCAVLCADSERGVGLWGADTRFAAPDAWDPLVGWLFRHFEDRKRAPLAGLRFGFGEYNLACTPGSNPAQPRSARAPPALRPAHRKCTCASRSRAWMQP